MEKKKNKYKHIVSIFITVFILLCCFCRELVVTVLVELAAAVLLVILYVFIPIPFQIQDKVIQQMVRMDYEELLSCIDQELPDGVKLSQVDVDHEEKTFCCEYEITAAPDTVQEHMSEYLAVKDLAEKALFDVGGVPRAYEIKIVLRQSPTEQIVFSNMTDKYRAQEARGEVSGGYHLIQTEIGIPCDLSSLSTLKDVEYLILDSTTIDDLSGLANLGDLIYLSYQKSRENGRDGFTEAEILTVKQMYPACRIMGYPREEPEEQYLIHSLEDYQRFACYVEAGYEDLDAVLMTDLDLGTWPYTLPSYRGQFDGNGYTISNGTKALIGKLGTGGVVENLNLEQMQITAEEDGTGAIAGYNYGTITGCQVSGHVEGMGYVGGIASINCGLIENCRNQAEVLSTASGANQKYNSSQMYEGYGAGGIAGYCGTAKVDGESPKECAITDCVNEGTVTAPDLVAGICSRLEDRTDGGASINSVQDLIENFDFAEREEGAESPGEEESEKKTKEEQRSHYSIRNCKNYGTITAEFRRDDDARKYTQVAGICAELYKGCLYHCASLGTVRFDSDAPDRSEDGWVYTNQPMAIAGIMGFAPVEEHHIIDCVSLRGTVDSPMRHENVMEISMDQMELWEKGELPYVSNNWNFDLEEAIKLCALEPLEIGESEQSRGKDEIYLCQDFILNLPKGFVIREMKVGGVCYGLQIRYEGKDEAYSDYETWFIRKTADMDQALEEIRTSNTPDEWRIQAFVQEVYDTLTSSHMWNIDSINLPFSGCYSLTTGSRRQNYLGDGLSSAKLNLYMQEGDHCLGNLAAMPLEGSQEDGLEAKWIFVFTNHETNIRPSAAYIDTIKECFYLLDGVSTCVQAKPGDNLWKLAEACTGDGADYLWLADMNHMTASDPLYIGDLVLLPDYERWEQRQNQISMSYLHE